MSLGISKHDREVFARLFGDNRETTRLLSRRKAEELLCRARPRTRTGSGYDLGTQRTALSTVCAYLACQELQNTFLPIKNAAAAACMSEKEFAKVVKKVEAALASTTKRSDTKNTAVPLSYETLIKEFSLSDAEWLQQQMNVVEQSYASVNPKQSAKKVTCAIFLWVCSVLNIDADRLGIETVSVAYKIQKKEIKDIIDDLWYDCQDEEGHLKRAYEERRKAQLRLDSTPSRPVSPAKAPKSPTKKFSPTKEDLHRRVISPSKRLLDEDKPESMDVDPAETPMKIRKLDLKAIRASGSRKPQIPFPTPSTKSTPSLPDLSKLAIKSPPKGRVESPATIRRSSRLESQQTPTRLRTRPSSPSKLGAMEVDDPIGIPIARRSTTTEHEEEDDDESEDDTFGEVVTMRRRSRWVYLDHREWLQCDPALSRRMKAAKEVYAKLSAKYGPPNF